jgi:hypothetical protein
MKEIMIQGMMEFMNHGMMDREIIKKLRKCQRS